MKVHKDIIDKFHKISTEGLILPDRNICHLCIKLFVRNFIAILCFEEEDILVECQLPAYQQVMFHSEQV